MGFLYSVYDIETAYASLQVSLIDILLEYSVQLRGYSYVRHGDDLVPRLVTLLSFQD